MTSNICKKGLNHEENLDFNVRHVCFRYGYLYCAGLLPDMGKSFNKSSAEIGQGVTVFTLFFALSAPIFSTILAKYSVKNILLIALLTFGVANLITMLSYNYSTYILSR